MNANEEKLVTALRSGEFKQTTLRLRSKDGFCCLGVACEIYRREVNPSAIWIVHDDYGCETGFAFNMPDNFPQETSLPYEVQQWLGWGSSSGVLNSHSAGCLSNMNDRGYTFEQIADAIAADKVEKEDADSE